MKEYEAIYCIWRLVKDIDDMSKAWFHFTCKKKYKINIIITPDRHSGLEFTSDELTYTRSSLTRYRRESLLQAWSVRLNDLVGSTNNFNNAVTQ